MATLTILSTSCANLSSETESLIEARRIQRLAGSHCGNNSWIKDPSVMLGVSPNNYCIVYNNYVALQSPNSSELNNCCNFFVLTQLCIL